MRSGTYIKYSDTNGSVTLTSAAGEVIVWRTLNGAYNLTNISYPSTFTFFASVYCTVQSGYAVVSFIPLMRADSYNYTFLSQGFMGTGAVANFGAERFVINKYYNGLMIFSSDPDIVSWFKAYPGIHSFEITATPA